MSLIAIDYDTNPEVKKAADELCAKLEAAGLSVLMDERDERPGVKFKDADLMGLPHRVVISSRTVKDGQFEYNRRADKESVRKDLSAPDAFVAELKK